MWLTVGYETSEIQFLYSLEYNKNIFNIRFHTIIEKKGAKNLI